MEEILLKYSCLENSLDRGAWWATVHGVTKSQEMTKHSTASLIYSVPGTVQASLVAQLVRYLPAIGRPGSNPRVGKILWIRERLPKTPIFWPGEFQGLYNPWGCKELAMTERLLLHFRHFTKCFTYSIAFNS